MRKQLLLLVMTGLVMAFWGISVAQEGAEPEPPLEDTVAVESTEAGQALEPESAETEEVPAAEAPDSPGLSLAEESDSFPIPQPVQVKAIDANNDDGTALGLMWTWGTIEIKLAAPEDVLVGYLAVHDPAWAMLEQSAELPTETETEYLSASQTEAVAAVRAILDGGKKGTLDGFTTYSLEPGELNDLLAGCQGLRAGFETLSGEYGGAYSAVSPGSLPDEEFSLEDFDAVLGQLDLLIERVAKYSEVFWTAQVAVEIKIKPDISEAYLLTPEEAPKLAEARAAMVEEISSFLAEYRELKEVVDGILIELLAKTSDLDPVVHELRKNYWQEKRKLNKLEKKIEKARRRYDSRVTHGGETLHEKFWSLTFASGALANLEWAASNIAGRADSFKLVKDNDHQFGLNPAEDIADRYYVELENMVLLNPAIYGTPVVEDGDINDRQPSINRVDLIADEPYELRIIVARGGIGIQATLEELEAAQVEYELLQAISGDVDAAAATLEAAQAKYDERTGKFVLSAASLYALQQGPVDGVMTIAPVLANVMAPTVNYFDTAFINNLVIAVLFGLVIMAAIMLARRNPNLFIRRIAGLEAVDEAIGRATEMGKPVLYLCGLDPLSTMSTLAAINILGRVARRVADYDSDLLVPCKDPIVLTVAQEVTREAYIDQGRPDAYNEDNVFFVTDDQFSFTATTCAIMMREKPAANFFMGYYYAESLLLAETGAATGAIQIAGTDALAQLPFFITTCDYTLIGEELYAASAYLSREPMLLGSLKGQDVGKAAVMVLIILQTILFLINDNWVWLKELVTPK